MADLMASLSAPLDDWQEASLEATMGERSNGKWAAKYVGMSVPRQNGKSQLMVARALAGVLLFGEKTIIISAHETDTAREVWKRLVDIIEANPNVEARVTGRMDAINREFIAFGHGHDKQTIKLKARRQSGSRGFSCDCLLLDEAQILGKRAWGSINPTMSARPNPQLWLFGTPPTEDDDAYAFTRVRESALKHAARHAWLEWSPDEDDDIDSPETWAKTNPAFGIRISLEACEDDRAAMDDDQFALERLGRWTVLRRDSELSGQWAMCADRFPESFADAGIPIVGLGLAPDRELTVASIVAVGSDDGRLMVKPVRRDLGVGWISEQLTQLQAQYDVPVCVDGGGPASSLVPTLERDGVKVRGLKTGDVFDAFDVFLVMMRDRSLRHGDFPELNRAIGDSGRRKSRDRWTWDRSRPGADLLEAATFAVWAAQNPEEQMASVYESRGVATV